MKNRDVPPFPTCNGVEPMGVAGQCDLVNTGVTDSGHDGDACDCEQTLGDTLDVTQVKHANNKSRPTVTYAEIGTIINKVVT